MVKQRMNSVDVAAECACLRHKALGMRVSNIYDMNAKTYVLKLARAAEEGEKLFLLLESGSRFHSTQVLPDKSDVPSNFSLKLRKHVRTKRLEAVRQLGVDRIVDFVFGSGEVAVHLILEMYSQGNIVLTDSKYEVLTLLRSHRDDDKGFAVMARHPYPMQHVRLRKSITFSELQQACEEAEPGAVLKNVIANLVGYGPSIAEHVILDAGLTPSQALRPPLPAPHAAAGPAPSPAAPAAATAGSLGRGAGASKAMGSVGGGAGLGSGEGGSEAEGRDGEGVRGGESEGEGQREEGEGGEEEGEEGEEGGVGGEGGAAEGGVGGPPLAALGPAPLAVDQQQLQELHAALNRLDAWFAGLEVAPPEGVITCLPPGGRKNQQQQKQQQAAASKASKSKAGKGGGAEAAGAGAGAGAGAAAGAEVVSADKKEEEELAVYNDFNPLVLKQLEGQRNLHFPTFDIALDEFFGKIAGQHALLARSEAERAALSKLDKIRVDQSARVRALAAESEEAELRAALIEYNLEVVDLVLASLNQSLAAGMDWGDLERLIKEERRAGNPVAQFIHSLQLDKNSATLLLSNTLDTEGEEGDEDANARKAVKVTVDLSLSAFANAALHHQTRKKHDVKQAKTLAANEAALKAAERKVETALQQAKAAPVAAVARKPHWFERFNWFISSENFLVISGRDAQQNELIVKRYFRKGDAYVHAELHGASSTIVKNHMPSQPIPPLTLQEAGCACVCRSRAWDSKMVTSAWWVHHHQVSKTAPTGEYLVPGSFMIRGKKNFLPPQPLVFGFGFMFKLEPSCIAAHVGERVVRSALDADTLSTIYGAATDLDADPLFLRGLDADTISAAAHDLAMRGWPADLLEDQDLLGTLEEGEEEGEGGEPPPATHPAAAPPQPSALDLFLEGGYPSSSSAAAPPAASTPGGSLFQTRTPSAGSGAGGGRGQGRGGQGGGRQGGGGVAGPAKLSAATLGALGGSTGAVQVVEQYQRYGLDASALAEGVEEGAAGGAGAMEGGGAPGRGEGRGGVRGGRGGQQQPGGAPQGKGGKGGQVGGAKAGAGKAAGGEQQGQGQGRPAPPLAPSAGSSARGKKGKAAKIKEKYADQDEEERALALQMLASTGGKKTRSDRRKERKERKEVARQAGVVAVAGVDVATMQNAIAAATAQQFSASEALGPAQSAAVEDDSSELEDASSSSSDEAALPSASQKREGEAAPDSAAVIDGGLEVKPIAGGVTDPVAGARASADVTEGGAAEVLESAEGQGDADGEVDPETSAAATAAAERDRAEVAALLADGGVAELGDDEKERLNVLNSLTGCPRADDILLFAVPVCGPYSTMQSWKFRVKVIPGTLKKGKAARQGVELLSRAPDASQRERELLKAVPEMDMINAMVGSVKLSMPGLTKLKQVEKKDKKVAAKEKAKAKAAAGGK